MTANQLRMPFAEWLYRMSEAKVPYQARTLAIYAAVFDITGNEELSTLCGASDRTFEKWKKLLSDEGWVIVRQQIGGRGRGVKVYPSIAETPVTFTDVSPRNPRKYYPRNNCETTAEITVDRTETPVEITPVSTETTAEIAGVTSPAYARAEVSINNNIITHQEDRSSEITNLEQAERGVRGENKNSQRAKPRRKPTDEQFSRFWQAYPLRKGKPKARDRFMMLTPEQAELAIDAAAAYAVECQAEAREPKYIKWAQGWLTERRFEDFEETDPREALRGPNGKPWGWWRGQEEKLREFPVKRWRAALAEQKPNGTWPWWVLTAPPGDKECLMPAELLEEFNLVEVYRGQITHD